LQQPPFHPKWREIAPQALLKGRTRFPAAQALLDAHPRPIPIFDRLATDRRPAAPDAAPPVQQGDPPFDEFLKWKQRNRAGAKRAAPQ
jgi:branched-chain amino acid transport system substrate-binding protein